MRRGLSVLPGEHARDRLTKILVIRFKYPPPRRYERGDVLTLFREPDRSDARVRRQPSATARPLTGSKKCTRSRSA